MPVIVFIAPHPTGRVFYIRDVQGLLQHRKLFFFHEYGRRVGMVPRSSLKEGKYSQMVEKRTQTTQQKTKNQNQPQPKGRASTIL